MELIDKDKVIAEIERVLNSYDPNEITSGRYALADLRDFINTLEVKEVDLEKEVGKYLDANDIEFSNQIKLLDFAKHFFELGSKMNNPITATDIGMAEEIIVALKRIEQDYCIDLSKEIQWLRDIVKKG